MPPARGRQVSRHRIRDRFDEQLVDDLVGRRLLHGAASLDRSGQGRIVVGRAGQRPVRLDGCRRSSGVWPIARRPLNPLSSGIDHSHRPVGLTAHRSRFAEKCGEAVVLTLGPGIERMIMATGALHSDAEQRAGGCSKRLALQRNLSVEVGLEGRMAA
jgi:hypothetical protein